MPTLRAVLQDLHCEACYVFSLDPPGADTFAYARFFNPADDLWEDAASGGAAGPLACHLHAHNLVRQDETILIEQGTAMGRKSIIKTRVTASAVEVSGSAVVVAEGVLRV